MIELIDHPLVLLLAIVVSAPIVWWLARSWFADLSQDVEEATPAFVLGALLDRLVPSWLLLKFVWFAIVSAAIVVFFYRIGAWVAEI